MSKRAYSWLFGLLGAVSTAGALAEPPAYPQTASPAHVQPEPPAYPQPYEERLAEKAGYGFTNLVTGWIEIPKNVINTSNDSNILFGLTGGVIKGAVHAVARMGGGAFDLLTSPIPTDPIVRPGFVWDDFETDTSYGRIRLSDEYR